MKKIAAVIFSILSFNCLTTGIMASENYAQEIREEIKKENEMKLLFENIQKGNNQYVKSRLKIKENLDLIEEKNKRDKKKYGPGDLEILWSNLKLENLIDVNEKNKYGFTPIIVAIEFKNNEILQLLLDNGADVYSEYPGLGKLTLHTAAYYENEEAIRILLEKYPTIINVQSQNDGFTALQESVLKNNVSIVKVLLENGANPRLKDKKGGTALDMATEFGKGEIVKELRNKIKQYRD